MGLEIKPNIKVDNIQFEKDSGKKTEVDSNLKEWGRNIPILKIGEYVPVPSDLLFFELSVGLNSLPSFRISISDSQFFIRQALKNNIDKCVVFLGWKNWYIKFNGILNKTYSEFGDDNIELTGVLYNEKLYKNIIKSYKDKSILDIIKEICKDTDMGLFTFDNNALTESVEYIINPNKTYLQFFDKIVSTYTDNLFAIDPMYHFHIGNMETIRKAEIDKYTINMNNGDSMEETDIILISRHKTVDEDKSSEKPNAKPTIMVDSITFDTNFTEVYHKYGKEYIVKSDLTDDEKTLITDDNVGIATVTTNTFSQWIKDKNPFYKERINKALGGNIIKLSLKNILFELSPFSVVDLKCFSKYRSGEEMLLDEEHSGKKICIGYRLIYNKQEDEDTKFPTLTQQIDLI